MQPSMGFRAGGRRVARAGAPGRSRRHGGSLGSSAQGDAEVGGGNPRSPGPSRAFWFKAPFLGALGLSLEATSPSPFQLHPLRPGCSAPGSRFPGHLQALTAWLSHCLCWVRGTLQEGSLGGKMHVAPLGCGGMGSDEGRGGSS